MRASQSQRAQPLPLPLPLPPPPLCLPSPAAAPRRGRHHRSSCSSSSSSSSSVSSASTFFCPSPSPRGGTASLVPFSWERHPGVPKNSFRGGGGLASPTGTPLPLPPPLQPARRGRRRRRRANVNIPAASSGLHANSDPFVAAFAECTRDDDGEDDEAADHGAEDAVAAAKGKLWLAPAKTTVSGRAARPWRTASGVFLSFLDLYGCKSAMAVADGAFLARRPVAAGPGPASGRATRR